MGRGITVYIIFFIFMRKLVLYKTKYGSTKLYAEWLNKGVKDTDLLDIKDFNQIDRYSYSHFIIGSCTYMGKILVRDFLIDNWDFLRRKRVFLFSVGNIPLNNYESIKSYKQIPGYIRDNLIGYTKLPGRIEPKELGLFNRLLVRFIGKSNTGDKMNKELLEEVKQYII